MIDLGPHAMFIISAYVSVFIVTGVAIIWVWATSNKQKKRLADLEARGIVRRSKT